jgi:hypothetical protein
MGRKYYKGDNIFYSDDRQTSTFWKGVVMGAKAVKLGYRWVPGNGKKIHFCENTWFGTAPWQCNSGICTVCAMRKQKHLQRCGWMES